MRLLLGTLVWALILGLPFWGHFRRRIRRGLEDARYERLRVAPPHLTEREADYYRDAVVRVRQVGDLLRASRTESGHGASKLSTSWGRWTEGLGK